MSEEENLSTEESVASFTREELEEIRQFAVTVGWRLVTLIYTDENAAQYGVLVRRVPEGDGGAYFSFEAVVPVLSPDSAEDD